MAVCELKVLCIYSPVSAPVRLEREIDFCTHDTRKYQLNNQRTGFGARIPESESTTELPGALPFRFFFAFHSVVLPLLFVAEVVECFVVGPGVAG